MKTTQRQTGTTSPNLKNGFSHSFLWSEYTYLAPPCIIHVDTCDPGGSYPLWRHTSQTQQLSFIPGTQKKTKKKDEIKLPHALEFLERSMVCAERYDIHRLPSINGWVEVSRDRHVLSLMEVWGEGLLLSSPTGADG